MIGEIFEVLLQTSPQWPVACFLIVFGGLLFKTVSLGWRHLTSLFMKTTPKSSSKGEQDDDLGIPDGYEQFRRFRSSSTSLPGLILGPLIGEGSHGHGYRGLANLYCLQMLFVQLLDMSSVEALTCI